MLRRAVLPAVLAALLGVTLPALAETAPQPAPETAAPTTPAAPATPAVPAAPVAPSTTAPASPNAAAGDQDESKTVPQVFYGEDGLPDKVKAMRRRILDATRTGELESLRPVIESNPEPPAFSGGDTDDPIATLKLLSGDDKGREILAILQEILEAGYVHVDVGTPQEMYVWPYFTRYPLDKLTGPQMVELFRLITAGDFQDMQDKGVYSFYRVGIGPDGTWHFFEDGD
jgi:hypothetical protein